MNKGYFDSGDPRNIGDIVEVAKWIWNLIIDRRGKLLSFKGKCGTHDLQESPGSEWLADSTLDGSYGDSVSTLAEKFFVYCGLRCVVRLCCVAVGIYVL